MEELKQQIKLLIISALNLEDMTPAQIRDDEAIFGAGLGLDSIDALELGIALKKKFGVHFNAENRDNRQVFASVNTLAAYVAEQQGGAQ
jgi:acyl carrier protein